MLEAVLTKANIFKKLLDSLKDIATEANFECSEADGLKLHAMDSTHCAFVNMLLTTSSFSKFRCNRTTTLGMNLTNLSKILKSCDNDDTLLLSAQEDGSTAIIKFESEKRARIAQYELKLTNIEEEQLTIPDIEYEATVTMSSVEFQSIIKELSVLGDSVTISVSKNGVKFSTAGDIGNGSIMVKQQGAVDKKTIAAEIEMNEPISISFGLKFLANFTKSTAIADTVKLQISKESPLVVSYQFLNDSYIKYYLAPKLESEDDDEVKQDEEEETEAD